MVITIGAMRFGKSLSSQYLFSFLVYLFRCACTSEKYGKYYVCKLFSKYSIYPRYVVAITRRDTYAQLSFCGDAKDGWLLNFRKKRQKHGADAAVVEGAEISTIIDPLVVWPSASGGRANVFFAISNVL